jgi:hypothetical protein
VLYGYLNFKRTVGWCFTVIWIWKEPWVGVVRLFEFGKNHRLVLYGYLKFQRTTGWCCMVIWILKEPRVGVVQLFEFWKNHGFHFFHYCRIRQLPLTVLWNKCKNERTMGPSYLQEPMVSKEGMVLGSVIWRISKLLREPWSATRTVDVNLSGIFDNLRVSVPGAPHSRKP